MHLQQPETVDSTMGGTFARRTAVAGVVGAGAVGAGLLLSPKAAAATRAPAFVAAAPRDLKVGMTGSDVHAMQIRLYQLAFWLPSADGNFGANTQQAVWAFQKAYGLARTGQWGAAERAKAASAKHVTVRYGNSYRIEVDKTRQLLMLAWGRSTAAWIFNTSTGANKPFFAWGKWWDGRTPSGTFRVYRTVKSGWVTGALGSMYKPYYFNGGIAVHGSASIPPYNASHGCCRLATSAQDFLISHNLLFPGRIVTVY